MRIGIDLSCWANQRGYGRYTRNLLQELLDAENGHAYIGFADATGVASTTFPHRLDVMPVKQSEPPAQAASATGRRRAIDLWRMSRAISRAELDVMFFPSTYTYVPVFGRTYCVVVIHDAIAERWPRLIFPTRLGRLAWTVKTHVACWQASRVVTVSHAAARAIQEHLPVSAERLRVIYEAADPVFGPGDDRREDAMTVRDHYAIPRRARLLLYVGGFGPHKNVEALLNAFARVAEESTATESPDHLALVGETTREVFHSCYPALRARVHALGLARQVTFTGYVPDYDLAELYRAAVGLVLPSRDEGFGLPVVEAMASGTPVVVSRADALRELVGEAGLVVDPDRVEEFAAALRRLLDEPVLRWELRQRGLRRAEQMSWRQAAADLLDVFDELATKGDRRSGRRTFEGTIRA